MKTVYFDKIVVRSSEVKLDTVVRSYLSNQNVDMKKHIVMTDFIFTKNSTQNRKNRKENNTVNVI